MAQSEYVKQPPMQNLTTRVPTVVLEDARELDLNVSKIVRDALVKEVNAARRRKSK